MPSGDGAGEFDEFLMNLRLPGAYAYGNFGDVGVLIPLDALKIRESRRCADIVCASSDPNLNFVPIIFWRRFSPHQNFLSSKPALLLLQWTVLFWSH